MQFYYVGPANLFGVILMSIGVVIGVFASFMASLPLWVPVLAVAFWMLYMGLYLQRRRSR